MKSWATPHVPQLHPQYVVPTLFLTDSRSSAKLPVPKKDIFRMYVCGITPYDATHLGHAATYLTFDLINRYLRASGGQVQYVQNITDIDDPLLERAQRDNVDWIELAHSQIDLFMSDMVNLRVIAPQHYIGAVEAIPLVVSAISQLQSHQAIYTVGSDYYFSNSPESDFGGLSHLDRSEMARIFAERGGDPSLVGKKDPLDCLVWMSQRVGEPGWDSPLGKGRPGWHIECTAIALEFLHPSQSESTLIDIQGGGSDLIFPHHEMCRSQAKILTGKELAAAYVHAGMIGLDGEKMSKSKGNLVLVSQLVAQGVDPMAIRIALMSHHYREDQMWSDDVLDAGIELLTLLRTAVALDAIPSTDNLIREIISCLADDLDTPRVIGGLRLWAQNAVAGDTGGDATQLRSALDALLGLAV